MKKQDLGPAFFVSCCWVGLGFYSHCCSAILLAANPSLHHTYIAKDKTCITKLPARQIEVHAGNLKP